MKLVYPRQRRQYVFAVLVGLIGLLNLLFFLILYRPARTEYYRLHDSIARLKVENRVRSESVGRLQKLNDQLEVSQQDRVRLFARHFVGRKDGFAEVLRKLEILAQESGVLKSRVEYQIEAIRRFGLYSVKIRMPLEGAYSNIVNFIEDVETSETFFIIDSVGVRSGGSAELELALNMETFFFE